jgi:hypothetical protein
MSATCYDYTIPIFILGLTQLKHQTQKAIDWCKEHEVEDKTLLQTRLIADMHPWIKQVQMACDFAKGAAARLASQELPKYADNESTLEETLARIEKTISFISNIPKGHYESAESKIITIKLGPNTFRLPGSDYLRRIVFPNFYFHLVTSYNILRSNGVPIGKQDFTGSLKFFLVPTDQ